MKIDNMDEKQKNLNFFRIALMYTGSILGAGFASGREIWQFFGVFGDEGIWGVLIVGCLFILTGLMTCFIAKKKISCQMGEIIVPFDGEWGSKIISGFMAFVLYGVPVIMSAAAGALFKQQFNLSPYLGGGLMIIAVTITVIGGIDRISSVFKIMMPLLLMVILYIAFRMILGGIEASTTTETINTGPLTKNWFVSAILYFSYNVLAIIPIVGTSINHSKSDVHGILGTVLGGVIVATLAFVILLALLKDRNFSQSMALPMLGYSAKFGMMEGLIYSAILLLAMYGSATGNYYGFTTRIKDDKNKKKKIIAFAVMGYVLSFIGFKNVVAYMFPIMGYIGLLIILMLMLNFFKIAVWRK